VLHPLNRPSCVAELEALITLQRRVLEYACSSTTYRDSDFSANLGPGFSNWLLPRRLSGAPSDKVVKRFFQDLTALTKCNLVDKKQVVSDFDKDQDYHKYLNDHAYRFSFKRTKSDAHEKAARCLVAFFDFLGIGYPPGIVSPSGSCACFRKADVIAGYKATNKFLAYVCPSCDSFITDSPGANPEGYTLEHYFPKDLYPSICLHPLNLIPMCCGCNGRKKNHDPLEPPATPPFRVSYDEVFHPTERPVRRHADLDFIPSPSGREQMLFVAHPGGKTYRDAIKAYGILYEIPERWLTLWNRVEQRIDKSVKNAIRTVTYSGATLDVKVFDKALSLAISDLEANCGFEHFNYPAARWLRWAQEHSFQQLWQDFGTP